MLLKWEGEEERRIIISFYTTPPSPIISLPEEEVCPQAQDLNCRMLPCGGTLIQRPKVCAQLPVDSVFWNHELSDGINV